MTVFDNPQRLSSAIKEMYERLDEYGETESFANEWERIREWIDKAEERMEEFKTMTTKRIEEWRDKKEHIVYRDSRGRFAKGDSSR